MFRMKSATQYAGQSSVILPVGIPQVITDEIKHIDSPDGFLAAH